MWCLRHTFFVFLGPSNHVRLRNNTFRLHSNWNYSIQCIYNLHNHVVIDNRDYLKVLMLIGWVRIEKKNQGILWIMLIWLPWVVERWADHVFYLEFLFEFSFSCVKRFEAFQNSSKIHFSLGEVLFIKVFTYVKFRILMNRWCEKNIYIIFHA